MDDSGNSYRGSRALNADDSNPLDFAHLRSRLLEWHQELGAQRPGEIGDPVEFLEHLLGPGICRRLGIFRLPDDFLLSIVMPVFNEVGTVEEVIRRVRACGIRSELI